jgi:hypothetical protein
VKRRELERELERERERELERELERERELDVCSGIFQQNSNEYAE